MELTKLQLDFINLVPSSHINTHQADISSEKFHWKSLNLSKDSRIAGWLYGNNFPNSHLIFTSISGAHVSDRFVYVWHFRFSATVQRYRWSLLFDFNLIN